MVREVYSFVSIISLVETCEQIGRLKDLPRPRHEFLASHNAYV
jgi:hypothetical protein